MTYLLRVVLPDRPGSLGAVATALGTTGADILTVDVVERGQGAAVDDLVVDLPAGRPPDVLITAAESVPGVVVESVRPFAGALDTYRELELVELVAADPAAGVVRFTEGAPRIFRSGWAIVVALVDGRPQRVAASSAAPETQAEHLPWLPLARACVLDETYPVPQPWRELGTELAAAPLGRPERAVVIGRPGGPAFRPSELARLAHLAGIVATVTG